MIDYPGGSRTLVRKSNFHKPITQFASDRSRDRRQIDYSPTKYCSNCACRPTHPPSNVPRPSHDGVRSESITRPTVVTRIKFGAFMSNGLKVMNEYHSCAAAVRRYIV